MSANTTIELRVRRDGAKTELLSPEEVVISRKAARASAGQSIPSQ